MQLPADLVIAREKVTHYLLVRQSRNDKSAFLARGGFSPDNPDDLVAALRSLASQAEAFPADLNEFGHYYEAEGVLTGPGPARLRVKTIWMTEHLSGLTKFVTLIPVEILLP